MTDCILLLSKLEGNKEAQKIFGVEFGDRNDAFNLDLYNLYQKMLTYNCKNKIMKTYSRPGYHDAGIEADKDENIKTGSNLLIKFVHNFTFS